MVEKMTTLKLKRKCKITTPIHKKIRFLTQQNTTTANQYYKLTHLHKTSVDAIHFIYQLLKDMTRFYATTQIFFSCKQSTTEHSNKQTKYEQVICDFHSKLFFNCILLVFSYCSDEFSKLKIPPPNFFLYKH